MEYDKIEVKNYLIKRLVDAETAIMEVQRFVDTEYNREAQYPNIFTRVELAIDAINEMRRDITKGD
jgi:hypothetical protein